MLTLRHYALASLALVAGFSSIADHAGPQANAADRKPRAGSRAAAAKRDPPKYDSVSSLDPQILLKCRAENRELIEAVLPHYYAALDAVEAVDEKTDTQIEKLDHNLLGRGSAGVREMTRIGRRLHALGDPCGVDLMERSTVLSAPISQAVLTWVKAHKREIDSTFPALVNKVTAAEKSVKKSLDRLMADGKWEEAETEFFEMLAEYQVDCAFLDANQGSQVLSRFGDYELRISQTVEERLTRRKTASAATGVSAYKQRVDDFLKNLADAVKQVGATGATDAAGESLPGPEAFVRLADEWVAVQGAASAARGGIWAALPSMPRGHVDLIDLEQLHAKNSKKIAESLGEIVSADAARVSAAEAPALYEAYVAACAPSLARATEPEYRAALAKGLDAIAAKDPAFAKSLGAYNLATGDLLRWRRRAGEAQAKALAGDYPSLPAKFFEISQAAHDQRGYFNKNSTNSTQCAVQGALSDAVKSTGPGLTNISVSAVNAQATTNDPIAWGGYDARVLVQATDLGADLDAAKKSLASLLLMEGGKPALGLDAAVAAWRAEHGVWLRVGGKTQGFRLYGVSPTYFNLGSTTAGTDEKPDADQAAPAQPLEPTLLTSLGPFAPEATSTNHQGELFVVFDVQPEWIVGDGFFVKASPK